MPEVIRFEKIKNQNIFENEYANLSETGNSDIEFKNQKYSNGGIVVIYAPNGTGKSSLCDVLGNEESTAEKMFVALYNGQTFTCEDKKFHVIKDQLNRNVIPGDTSDYLIGADIRREYELKRRITNNFQMAFAQNLPAIYKKEFKVSKIGDFLLTCFEDETSAQYIKEIVNARKRGKEIDKEEFIEFMKNGVPLVLPTDISSEKRDFIINDSADSKLVEKILRIVFSEIVTNAEIDVIEQNDDAIEILKKYSQVHSCIVCDNEDFDPQNLLMIKTENKRRIYESLDSKTKEILDGIVNDKSLKITDPFNIKKVLTKFIISGETDDIQIMVEDIQCYLKYVTEQMRNILLSCFNNTSMLADFEEYTNLLKSQPEIDSEELLFIQKIISENIGPEITIVRDEENDKNFKLMLAGQEFLGVEREKLHLSNGEQNFISLSFELLLARKSNKEFIVMDDPISSFDSVYKNKIAFCIVKFLENKKQIVLTHNTDLIRLLEVQQNGCYNLYLFNNTNGGRNGFIKVKNDEKEILINLSKLIKLFQNIDGNFMQNIVDEKYFLISMIPFMRGYAHICKDGESIYSSLSGLMHGYENCSINITDFYETLFGYRFSQDYIISTNDILSLDVTNINTVNTEVYPLLAETLRQTLIYYYLRMKVEKELVDIFNVQIRPNHPLMLNDIIQKTLRYNDGDSDAEEKREYKVFFTSRKTLLNEFNHFEGNMNIFQPAIDIEASTLQKEVEAIEAKLIQLRNDYV